MTSTTQKTIILKRCDPCPDFESLTLAFALQLRKSTYNWGKVVKKPKHFKFNNFLSPKSCCLGDNVAKYGRTRQATDDTLIRRTRYSCRITKASNTHSEYVILITFPLQHSSCTCASKLRYVRTLSVLLIPVLKSCPQDIAW